MSLNEWFGQRELLLTGITSELGRAVLEKILRLFPNVTIHTIVRLRRIKVGADRVEQIFSSSGYERLRQEQPNALSRVNIYVGNLLYDDLGLNDNDLEKIKKVEIVFHAGGPFNDLIEFCRNNLPKLRVIAIATSLFKQNDIFDDIRNEKFTNIPITVLRYPIIGPAYKEPMPGFVEIIRGPTAIMIGAGYAFGCADLPAEVAPIDLAVNALIIAAWERGTRDSNDIPAIYNMPSLGCTWDKLIEKGQLARRKFPYPTFGISGMTSIAVLHCIVVFFLEWLPSAFCDNILILFGMKPRCIAEYTKIHEAINSLKEITTRQWFADRIRIHQIEERLTEIDRKNFPVCCDIDLEAYVLCAAASAKKNCVDMKNIQIFKIFKQLFTVVILSIIIYFIYNKCWI